VAAVELALGVLVVLIPMALLALSFGPTLERRSFVRSASAETARYIVLTEGNEVAALDRLREVAMNNGIRPSEMTVSLCRGPMTRLSEPPRSTCSGPDGIGRGALVEVRLEVDVIVFPVPRIEGALIRVGYRHIEIADLYRSIP
jgi:hypothetical protein